MTTRHLDAASGPERVTAVMADLELFSILRVEPIAGRAITTNDSPDVVVISERLWDQRFRRDPSLVGRTLTLDGHALTVIGVMPASFQFPYRAASLMAGALPESRTDVWVPLEPLRFSADGTLRQGRLSVIARLKPGIGLEAGNADLRLLASRVEEQLRAKRIRIGVQLSPLSDVVLGPVRRSLWMLFAAVSLVLAAACANVANLLLARMAVRTREVATRAALGAGRLRLVRQFLAESLLLSLAGGLMGAVIARWGTSVLIALCTGRVPRADQITLDWQAFAFLLLACLTTALLFGLAPAFMAARVDVHGVTKEAGGHATLNRSYRYLRDSLVVLEIALAFVLAMGAALVIREIVRLQHVESGMVTENVIALHLTPRVAAADYYAIEARVAELPRVRAAGLTQLVPLQNWGWEAGFSIRGRPDDPAERRVAGLRYVTPGYFGALGIPIRAGRALAPSDTADAPKVILVNEAFGRRYFPGEDPIGRETNRGTIVGVVGDVRNVHLDRPAEPELYYPAAQNVTMASDIGMSLLVRTEGRPEPLIQSVRAAVKEANPRLAVFNIRTMEQVLEDSLWELNLYRWLIGLFATLALVLAAIGLFGVISYTAAARTREFGIRLALGSKHSALGRLVLRRGLWLAAAGLACGVGVVLALTWWLDELPAGVRPDAATASGVALVLLVITLLACAVPAIRAAAVDPVTALRQE